MIYTAKHYGEIFCNKHKRVMQTRCQNVKNKTGEEQAQLGYCAYAWTGLIVA